MPRSYERKTAHSYTEYDLKMALFLVQEGNYGARCVARSTGVPLSTLKRKLKTNSPAQRNVFNKIQKSKRQPWLLISKVGAHKEKEY